MITTSGKVKVYESPVSTLWVDESGIVYSSFKKGIKRTVEETKETIEVIKKITVGKRICMLADISNSSESTREIRNYAAEELPKFIKALAIVSSSAVGKMLGNLFLTLKTQSYPTKIFNNEKGAWEWLQQYL